MQSCDIRVTAAHEYHHMQWEDIAHAVLGASYEFSLIICGDALARKINTQGRNKSYSPNVLSFPLSNTSGEVLLNVRKSERECASYGHSRAEHILYLYIHGLLHLKGHEHGATMENAERRFMKKFA